MALTQLDCKKCWACNQCKKEMKEGILKKENGMLVVTKDGKPERGEPRKCRCNSNPLKKKTKFILLTRSPNLKKVFFNEKEGRNIFQ